MNLHTAILPNGNTAKRTSANRVYTHAVVTVGRKWNAETKTYVDADPNAWGVYGFNGSLALAQQAAASLRGKRWIQAVQVVPVTMVVKAKAAPKDPAKAAAAAAKAKATKQAGWIGPEVKDTVRWILVLDRNGDSKRADDATEQLVISVTRLAHFATQRLAMEGGL